MNIRTAWSIRIVNCNSGFKNWILHFSTEFSRHEMAFLDSEIDILCSGLHLCIPNSKTEFWHWYNSICCHAVPSFIWIYLLCNCDNAWGITLANSPQQLIAISLTENERKVKTGSFVVHAIPLRVECPSLAFFIIYLYPSWKYSSETKEKLTFSYRFLYWKKKFR